MNRVTHAPDPHDLARQILTHWPHMGFMDAEIDRLVEHGDIDALARLARTAWAVAVYRDHTTTSARSDDPLAALLAEIARAERAVATANQSGKQAAQQAAHRALTDLLSSTALDTARRHQEHR
ncbi:MAG: hypothetical protein U5R31_03160 [Acidimicrobiia bacterium]|nr:hypothetical protein [Acidimicrobiia bacterium]